jgi:hypothetical protein
MARPTIGRPATFDPMMLFTRANPIVRLCGAVCAAGAFLAVSNVGAQEISTPLFPIQTDSAAPEPGSRGWTASEGRWTAVRRTSYEQPMPAPEMPEVPAESSTFPQIRQPLESPQPLAGRTPDQIGGSNLAMPAACPECGAPSDSPSTGLCVRCLHSGGKLLHLLSPKRWFQSDPELVAQREPWRYRPYSVGLFMGPIVGSPLISDSVQQGTGYIDGARFGYDFDDDWGLEMRLASCSFPVTGGYPVDGTEHSSDHFLWDIDFLYYPWGDAAVRPYVLMGIGTARIKFANQDGVELNRIMAGMPIGIGLKWRMSDWFIFRLECLDNVAFAGGSNFHTQHNPSLTGGLEIRFGRPHVQYWPWNPGMRQ